jgi:hypothetical protein
VKPELWIESLTVENLGPFVGRRTFNFGRTSEELVICILGSSGSGKTYLANALCWVFDLPAPALSGRFASAVNENGDHFSVEAELQVDGVGYTVNRNSLASQDFVAPDVSIIHFDEYSASNALEQEFFSNGGHGRGALLLYALTKFFDDLKNRGDYRPVVFDAPFGRMDVRQRNEAFDALLSHPGQIILCGSAYDCKELLDRGCPIRVLEI